MTIDIDTIHVASPCPASWDAMTGDDRVRHCAQCDLNVYNLSDMTRDEARALIESREGRLCVRFYRRDDGTMLTRDCPVGWQRLRRAARRARVRAAALLACLFPAFLSCTPRSKHVMGDYCAPEDGATSAQPLQGKPAQAPKSTPKTPAANQAPTSQPSSTKPGTKPASTPAPKKPQLIELLGEVHLGRLGPIPKKPVSQPETPAPKKPKRD